MKLLAGVIVLAAAQSGDGGEGSGVLSEPVVEGSGSEEPQLARQRAIATAAVADEDEYEYYYVYENDDSGFGLARSRGKKTKKKRKKKKNTAAPFVIPQFNDDNAFGSKSGDYYDYGLGNQFDQNRGSFNVYDYSAPVTTPAPVVNLFHGLEYDDYLDQFNLEVGPNGKIGLTLADDNETRAWSYFHRLWGHAHDSRRHNKDLNLARNFQYTGAATRGWDVTNNLVDSRTQYQSTTGDYDGLYGKTMYERLGNTNAPNKQPWKILNHHDSADATVTWGSSSDWPATTTSNYLDFGLWDSSWELGRPASDANLNQVTQRWFEGINSSRNGATNQDNDTARLRCWHCEVQYGLRWNPTTRVFELNTTGYTGNGAWSDCEEAANGRTRYCEYSSGVCFVEERRTYGFTTLVRKGCKQAQACYRNKHQNFLVQAGRQCWPGDPRNMNNLVPRRPHDVKADQWIYNIVQGGGLLANAGWGLENGSNGVSDSAANAASALAANFDNTFTDVDSDGQLGGAGTTEGFYIDPAHLHAETVDEQFYMPHTPIGYKNGYVFTSWCYQCCNTGSECNKGWKPETERDWAENWISGTAITNDVA